MPDDFNLRGTDILQSLLTESLKTPEPGWSSGLFQTSPEDEAVQRKPSIDAIVHTLATGREPVAVPKPHMGGLLGRLGVTSQYQQGSEGMQADPTGRLSSGVSPGLRDQITLAQRVAGQQGRQQTLDKLDAVLRGTTIGGTTYGKSLADKLGIPEMGEGLPSGVEGKGQLAQSAQYNKLQQMLFSQDAREREMADREWHNQMSAAIQENRLDDANQLMNIRQSSQDLREQQYQTNPIYRTLQGRQARLESRINELMRIKAEGVMDPEQGKAIDNQIKQAEDEIYAIDEGMAEAGNDPEKLRKLLAQRPSSSTTDTPHGASGDIPPIKPGTFGP